MVVNPSGLRLAQRQARTGPGPEEFYRRSPSPFIAFPPLLLLPNSALPLLSLAALLAMERL